MVINRKRIAALTLAGLAILLAAAAFTSHPTRDDTHPTPNVNQCVAILTEKYPTVPPTDILTACEETTR